jgi:hypothetical protein
MSTERSGVEHVATPSRKTRMDEARRLEERINEMKPQFNMDYKDPLHIIAPEGWTYMWVRIGFRDGPDSNRETEMMAKGWTPVPADRHPEKMTKNLLGQTQEHNFIVDRGLLLCEMPTVFVEMERDKLNKHNIELMRSMPGLNNNLLGNKAMPVTTKGSELKVRREYGFK